MRFGHEQYLPEKKMPTFKLKRANVAKVLMTSFKNQRNISRTELGSSEKFFQQK